MAEIKIENLKYRYPDTKELALDGITSVSYTHLTLPTIA